MDKERNDMDSTPSGIVELIIAVDLDPSDPQEPINVNDVSVKPKGEAGEGSDGEDWKALTMQLLMGDPQSGVTSDSISYDEAVDAVASVLGDSEKPEEPKDAFSKMNSPKEEEAPKAKPYREGKSGGGMKGALKRAIGFKKPEGSEMEPKDDEDEEEM